MVSDNRRTPFFSLLHYSNCVREAKVKFNVYFKTDIKIPKGEVGGKQKVDIRVSPQWPIHEMIHLTAKLKITLETYWITIEFEKKSLSVLINHVKPPALLVRS